MTDAQIVISVIFAVVFFVILIFNVVSYPNVELYKKKYDELERGVYKYETNYGNSLYFYLYSYNINTLTAATLAAGWLLAAVVRLPGKWFCAVYTCNGASFPR